MTGVDQGPPARHQEPAGALPALIEAGGRRYLVERARAGDVPAVVELLLDDPIGAGRETARDLAPYREAFVAVDADPRQLLVVAREGAGRVVATLQLSFLRSLSRGGATRMQVEAVRVSSSTRGTGLGRGLLGWAADHGRARGAVLGQLTSDLRRTDAHRFYEGLGWRHTHAGMKLDLTTGPPGPQDRPGPAGRPDRPPTPPG